MIDRKSALGIVKKVLMADYACEEKHLEEEGVWFCEARKLKGARRYLFRAEKYLAMATMGTGAVITCTPDRMNWAKKNLSKLTRDNLFNSSALSRIERYIKRDGQCTDGITLAYICAEDTFRSVAPPDGIEMKIFSEKEIPALYDDKRFPNSLTFRRNPETPDMIAVLATYQGERVGMAGASADCDTMWQVGVDTLPEYRRRGIAEATVSIVTENIIKRGIVPFYTTAVSNIASRRTALSLGYRPAWVEIFSREIKRDEDTGE